MNLNTYLYKIQENFDYKHQAPDYLNQVLYCQKQNQLYIYSIFFLFKDNFELFKR